MFVLEEEEITIDFLGANKNLEFKDVSNVRNNKSSREWVRMEYFYALFEQAKKTSLKYNIDAAKDVTTRNVFEEKKIVLFKTLLKAITATALPWRLFQLMGLVCVESFVITTSVYGSVLGLFNAWAWTLFSSFNISC